MTLSELEDKLYEEKTVAILLHIDTVKAYYDVTDEEALELLEEVKYNDWIDDTIMRVIDEYCKKYEYKEKG